jgi:hypothetical protein
MAVIAGTNLASVRTAGTTSATGQLGTNQAACIDDQGKYVYASMTFSGSASTTAASGQGLTGTITVGVTTNFLSPVGFLAVPCTSGTALVQYTGTTGTTFTGCTVINGATGTTTGTNVTQSPSIAQVRLSDMTILNRVWAGIPLAAISSIFYDAVGSQVVVIGTGNVLYGVPISGSGGTAGTPATLNGGASITNIVTSGTLHFVPDLTLGIVWQIGSQNKQVFGFYFRDPSSYHADYTPVFHACTAPFLNSTNFLNKGGMALGYGLTTAPHDRIANVNGSVPGVYRWRADNLNVSCLIDDQGAAQSSGTSANSASYSGPAVLVPQGLAYDPTGILYVLPATLTNLAYSISADELTTVALNSGTALTHTNSTLVGNPFFVGSNGYTTSGSLPQLCYVDAQAVNVCD